MGREGSNQLDGETVPFSIEDEYPQRMLHHVTGHPVTARQTRSGELWWYLMVTGTLAVILVGLLGVVIATPAFVDGAMFAHHAPGFLTPGGPGFGHTPFDPSQHWGVWPKQGLHNKGVASWL